MSPVCGVGDTRLPSYQCVLCYILSVCVVMSYCVSVCCCIVSYHCMLFYLIGVCCIISYQCVLYYILSVCVVLYLISVCCIKLLQMQRLPCLPSSNILLDTLTGRDEMIGFEDVLNGETKTTHMHVRACTHTHTHTSMHSWQTTSKPLHTFVGQAE